MIEPFIGDGDPDRRMVIELVVADLETERLEQHPQMLVRRIEQVDADDRQFVEQALVARASR